MTDKELTRFALVLNEAERIRAQIAEDEAAARASDNRGELSLPAAPSAERPSIPAAA